MSPGVADVRTLVGALVSFGAVSPSLAVLASLGVAADVLVSLGYMRDGAVGAGGPRESPNGKDRKEDCGGKREQAGER
jgi:hypothetical protein